MGTTNQPPIQPYQNANRVAFSFWRQPVFQAGDGTYWCPGFEGLTYAASPWDYVAFGTPSTTGPNIPSTPGIVEVSVAKFRDVDKKKTAGSDGARITIHGIEPAEVELRLKIWTPEQYRQLLSLWPFLFPTAGKGSPAAYDVQHPLFTVHDIKAIQFVRGEGPMVDPQGVGHFTMRAIEFLKPTAKKKVTKTEVKALATVYDNTAAPPYSVATPGQSKMSSNP